MGKNFDARIKLLLPNVTRATADGSIFWKSIKLVSIVTSVLESSVSSSHLQPFFL